MRACVTSWVSLSRDALEKGLRRLGSCRTFARGGRSPPAWTVPRSGRGGSFFWGGGEFGIKQGMRGKLVIKIGLGVSVRVDGKPRLKCVDCSSYSPPTHNLIKVCAHGTSGAVRELREREDFNEPSAPVVSSERRLSPCMISVNSMRNVSGGLRVKVARFLRWLAAPESGGKEACWSGRRSVCPHRRRRVGERVAAIFTWQRPVQSISGGYTVKRSPGPGGRRWNVKTKAIKTKNSEPDMQFCSENFSFFAHRWFSWVKSGATGEEVTVM